MCQQLPLPLRATTRHPAHPYYRWRKICAEADRAEERIAALEREHDIDPEDWHIPRWAGWEDWEEEYDTARDTADALADRAILAFLPLLPAVKHWWICKEAQP